MFDQKEYMKKYNKQYYQNHKEENSISCKKWYIQNKERHSKQTKQYHKQNKERILFQRRKKRNTQMIWAKFYFGDRCNICGGIHLLHFHHIVPSTKVFNISMGALYASPKRFVAELGKCVLLCASCHLKEKGRE